MPIEPTSDPLAPTPSPGSHAELGEPFMTAHSGCEGGPFIKLKYGSLGEMQPAHTALVAMFRAPRSAGEFSFEQPFRSRMHDVLRRLGQAAIRTQKITDHDAANTAQRECLSEIEALVTAALAASPTAPAGEPVAWLPIDTAPKDGSAVLLRFAGPFRDSAEDGIAKGMWTGRDWWLSAIWASTSPHAQPTHWMPLPASPSKTQEV